MKILVVRAAEREYKYPSNDDSVHILHITTSSAFFSASSSSISFPRIASMGNGRGGLTI